VPSNIGAALAYLLIWVSGLILLLVEKDNRHVRFHAAQSVLIFGGITVLGMLLPIAGSIIGVVPVLGPILKAIIAMIGFLLGIAALVAWIMLVVFALFGWDYRAPYVDSYADQIAQQTA
jgi:uncharacterized membrane protein